MSERKHFQVFLNQKLSRHHGTRIWDSSPAHRLAPLRVAKWHPEDVKCPLETTHLHQKKRPPLLKSLLFKRREHFLEALTGCHYNSLVRNGLWTYHEMDPSLGQMEPPFLYIMHRRRGKENHWGNTGFSQEGSSRTEWSRLATSYLYLNPSQTATIKSNCALGSRVSLCLSIP